MTALGQTHHQQVREREISVASRFPPAKPQKLAKRAFIKFRFYHP